MRDDFTTFVAVDMYTAEIFRNTIRTWKRFHPEIFDRPFHVICDAGPNLNRKPWAAGGRLDFLKNYLHPVFHAWDWPKTDSGTIPDFIPPMGQRERMLTGFVRLMHECETPYVLKLDVNMVATSARGGDGWIPDFRTGATVYAPRWGYTVPAEWIGDMDRWAEGKSILNPRPFDWHPLTNSPKGRREFKRDRWRFYFPRYWSCMAFYERDFLKLCSTLCPEPARLPIPSEDTYRWYIAHRLEMPMERIRPKDFGWEKRSRASLKTIEQTVKDFLA